MSEKRLNFGSKAGMRFILDWRSGYPTSNGPIAKTWGEMQLWVQDTLVWGYIDESGKTIGIAWNWIDILEFMGNAWPYLIEEEQHPIAFGNDPKQPTYLNELWGNVKLRLHNLPNTEADEEDELFRDFLAVHDFSEALYGASVPKLLCLRRGNQLLAATERQEWVLPFADTLSTLQSLGDSILSRLDELKDRRSEIARNRWNKRDSSMSPIQRWQIATGMDAGLLHRVLPRDIVTTAANDETYQIKAAARMLGKKLTESQLRDLLEKVNNTKHTSGFDLSDLWPDAKDILHRHESDKPAIQGYYLANMLREAIDCPIGKVDPEALLSEWGVVIEEFEIGSSDLDAIAVWRNKSTPTVLLNMTGRRTQYPTGKRSTLAHEICHILVDMDGALPAIEVLGGEVARPIEQRADAFAAEFLLPRAQAKLYFEQKLAAATDENRENVIDLAVNDLAKDYDVSHEMTVWQIVNSAAILREDDNQILNKYINSISKPFPRN